MGLDIVGLIMAIEHDFGVDLPEAGLRAAETVGQLHALIVGELHATEAVESDEIWTRLVDVIERETGVARERIVPGARFIRDFGLG